MNFNDAINYVRKGAKVRRESWEKKDWFIHFVNERICNHRNNIFRFSDEDIWGTDWQVINENNSSIPFSFSTALMHLKHGQKVTRACWKNPNAYIFLMRGITSDAHSYIACKTMHGIYIPWSARHDELLAEDWMIVNDR